MTQTSTAHNKVYIAATDTSPSRYECACGWKPKAKSFGGQSSAVNGHVTREQEKADAAYEAELNAALELADEEQEIETPAGQTTITVELDGDGAVIDTARQIEVRAEELERKFKFAAEGAPVRRTIADLRAVAAALMAQVG